MHEITNQRLNLKVRLQIPDVCLKDKWVLASLGIELSLFDALVAFSNFPV